MNTKIVYLSATILFTGVQAQVSDSIFIPQNNIYQHQLEKIWENPIQVSRLPFADFTASELSYNRKDLNLKRVQTAQESDIYNFKTEGIFNLSEKLRLLGDFDYKMIRERGLGYNLSNERTEDDFLLSPNYLFAPKKSRWETQKYNIKAGATYQLGRFDIGATVDYLNQSANRKSDPRPQIMTADYSGKIFGGVRLGKHQISANGALGRKTETYDIETVNESIISPANPDYFIRFSNGYGRWMLFSSYSDYIFKTTDKSLGGGYSFQHQKHFASVNYTYDFKIQTLYGKDASNGLYLDDELRRLKYRMVTHNTDANYWYNGENMEWMTNVNFRYFTGDNYNLEESGQNFRTTNDRLSVNNRLLLKDKDRVKLGASLEAAYTDFSAIDLLGITHKYVKSLDFQLKLNRDIYFKEKQKINAEIGARMYFPLEENLSYVPASSSTVMYDNVILPDHLFDKTAKIGPTVNVQFFQKITDKTTLKIFTNFAGLFAMDNYMNSLADFNDNPNFYGGFGISLYY